MTSKIIGKLKSAPKPKRNTTSRKRRNLRINKRDLEFLKQQAKAKYPNTKSYKALYVEEALAAFLSRDSLIEADFADPDDDLAIEFTRDLMIYMDDDDLSATEVFSIKMDLYENLYGYDLKIRRFLEMHRDWFTGEPKVDRVFSALFRYAISTKVRKDRAINRFNELMS